MDTEKLWALMFPFIILLGINSVVDQEPLGIMYWMFFLVSAMSVVIYFKNKHKSKIRSATWAEIKKSIRWI